MVRKRRRLKKKFKIIFSVLGVLLLLLLINLFTLTSRTLSNIGFEKNEISYIKKLNKTAVNYLKDNYVDNIINYITSNDFIDNNIERYVKYYNDANIELDSVIFVVNNNLDKVDNFVYADIIFDLFEEKYFIYELVNEYIEYYNSDIDLSSNYIVSVVNSKTNYGHYTNTTSTNLEDGNLILVNKYTQLPSDYVPDVVTIDSMYGVGNLTQEAYNAFKLLYEDAANDGYYIQVNSSYRSYDYQVSLYNNYSYMYGQAQADTFSARAGFSEHQTGLTMDVGSAVHSFLKFETTDEFIWMSTNCHKYGFILRYPDGKEHLTGYTYEAWHYRYVGVDVATYIYENDITFDEYYRYYIEYSEGE